MLILSFDIGIKNLAYCLLDTEDKCILDWNILDCSGENETLRVIKELDDLEYLKEADVVLLEKQPSFNPKMRIVSTAIYVYFTLRILHEKNKNVKIIYYSAKNKLKNCPLNITFKTKNRYLQNKKLAVEYTKFLLNEQGNSIIKFFNNCKKKDDLADCYLQALSYLI